MSEFSLPCSNVKKKTEYLSSLILSYFMLFCSFILSHPLYFSYFIFFSPYLFKILSFLSPLFATTSLLLLALFTLTPTLIVHGSNLQLPKSNPSFLLSTYPTFVETLPSEETVQDDDFSCFQVLEVIKMVFESSDIEIQPDPLDDPREMCPDQSVQPAEPVKDHPKLPEAKQVKNLVAFFQEKQKLETLSGKKGEKEVKATNTLADKGDEQQQTEEFFKPVRGSKALGSEKVGEDRTFIDDPPTRLRSASSWGSGNGEEKHKFNKLTENYSQPLDSYHEKIGTFGSMRREKEWRRTLACKLFEERNNGAAVEGGEGMDLLWEAYETETAKKSSHQTQLKSGSKKGKNSRGTNYNYNDHQSDYCSANGDEDYDEEESEGPLCCLQALKFSAGKMNLGMGRPNLLKISKALKGIGWLHHVGSGSPRRSKKSSYHH